MERIACTHTYDRNKVRKMTKLLGDNDQSHRCWSMKTLTTCFIIILIINNWWQMIVTGERDTVLKDRLRLVSTTLFYHLARQVVDNFTPMVVMA